RKGSQVHVRILLTGLSHNSAPLALRESLSLTKEQIPKALDSLRLQGARGVILSTCNRTEVYTVARDTEHGHAVVDSFLQEQFGVDLAHVRPYLYSMEQDDAVNHLFRVASGLDSLIIGESEILGQVRDSYSTASHQGAAHGVLAHVFHGAIRTGRRARTETAIGRNALSVSRACVELARRSLGDLSLRRALIVGVGEASRLAAQALRDAGIGTLVIANRTRAYAEELARDLDGLVAPLDELPSLMADADIVVSSTGAPDFVITRGDIESAMEHRNGRPLLVVDIALPRDVEPAAGSLDGVHLYTLDDLESIAEANRRERHAEVHKVERIIDDELSNFRAWWAARGVTPTIASLRHRAESLRAAEVARTLGRIEGLSDEQVARIDAMTKAMMKKLLHDPTKALRNRNDEWFTQSARELFGLDEPQGS
ncbi:MAG: glutamyl-tRNA reductase, partial [Dehalococcoidia bacterium]